MANPFNLLFGLTKPINRRQFLGGTASAAAAAAASKLPAVPDVPIPVPPAPVQYARPLASSLNKGFMSLPGGGSVSMQLGKGAFEMWPEPDHMSMADADSLPSLIQEVLARAPQDMNGHAFMDFNKLTGQWHPRGRTFHQGSNGKTYSVVRNFEAGKPLPPGAEIELEPFEVEEILHGTPSLEDTIAGVRRDVAGWAAHRRDLANSRDGRAEHDQRMKQDQEYRSRYLDDQARLGYVTGGPSRNPLLPEEMAGPASGLDIPDIGRAPQPRKARPWMKPVAGMAPAVSLASLLLDREDE